MTKKDNIAFKKFLNEYFYKKTHEGNFCSYYSEKDSAKHIKKVRKALKEFCDTFEWADNFNELYILEFLSYYHFTRRDNMLFTISLKSSNYNITIPIMYEVGNYFERTHDIYLCTPEYTLKQGVEITPQYIDKDITYLKEELQTIEKEFKIFKDIFNTYFKNNPIIGNI